MNCVAYLYNHDDKTQKILPANNEVTQKNVQSLPFHIKNIIKSYGEAIDKFNEKINTIESQLYDIRNNKSKLTERYKNGEFIGEDQYKLLQNNIYYLSDSELKIINERFNFQKEITKLQEEVNNVLGVQQMQNKVNFKNIVQVHDYKLLKNEGKYNTQLLDQSYTNRETKNPKLKENPKKFIEKLIQIYEKKFEKRGKEFNYEIARKRIKAKIKNIEFSANEIQKKRFIFELDSQLSSRRNQYNSYSSEDELLDNLEIKKNYDVTDDDAVLDNLEIEQSADVTDDVVLGNLH